MTKNQKTILILALLSDTLIDAKCNCVRPRQIHHAHHSVPHVSPLLPTPTSVQMPEQFQPAPMPTPLPSQSPSLQYQPISPMPIIEPMLNFDELIEEPAVTSEKTSKDEARKVALVLSSVVATAMVIIGALFAKVNGRIDAQAEQRLGVLEGLAIALSGRVEVIEKMLPVRNGQVGNPSSSVPNS